MKIYFTTVIPDALYNVEELCRILSKSEPEVLFLLNTGQIDSTRKGENFYIFGRSIKKYVTGLITEKGA